MSVHKARVLSPTLGFMVWFTQLAYIMHPNGYKTDWGTQGKILNYNNFFCLCSLLERRQKARESYEHAARYTVYSVHARYASLAREKKKQTKNSQLSIQIFKVLAMIACHSWQ